MPFIELFGKKDQLIGLGLDGGSSESLLESLNVEIKVEFQDKSLNRQCMHPVCTSLMHSGVWLLFLLSA